MSIYLYQKEFERKLVNKCPGAMMTLETDQVVHLGNVTFYLLKGRVSRFGACASDDVCAVKLIVFGPIRSKYTTPAGYGG